MAKKTNNISPTIKQKRAVKNMVENGGNASKAMRDAGYSKNTAVCPHKLTESKGYEELLKEYLPDDKVLKKICSGAFAQEDKDAFPYIQLISKMKGWQIDKKELTGKDGKDLVPTAVNIIQP